MAGIFAFLEDRAKFRVTTSRPMENTENAFPMENLEMSGILTAVSEISVFLLKVEEMWKNLVLEKWPGPVDVDATSFNSFFFIIKSL